MWWHDESQRKFRVLMFCIDFEAEQETTSQEHMCDIQGHVKTRRVLSIKYQRSLDFAKIHGIYHSLTRTKCVRPASDLLPPLYITPTVSRSEIET